MNWLLFLFLVGWWVSFMDYQPRVDAQIRREAMRKEAREARRKSSLPPEAPQWVICLFFFTMALSILLVLFTH
jgi:hypothetical protein